MKTKNSSESGNAFLYILIAVILFGALIFTLSRTSDNDDGTGELAEGQKTIAVNEILAYAASAQNVLTQMQASAVQTDQIDFMVPSDSAFNDPPTIYKFFHPDGGGMTLKTLPKVAIDDNGSGVDPGYYIGRYNSIEWTPSTTNDILFTAYELKQDVCAAINLKLTGDATIPTVIGDSAEDLFVPDDLHAGTNTNFEVSNCADCEEKPALCVEATASGGVTEYVFYSIMEAE